MTNFSNAAAGSSFPSVPQKKTLHRATLIALGCSLSVALAASAAVAGASASASLMLAGLPAAGLLLYAMSKAIGWANRLDVFSPLVAFPVLYVAWFALGSIDLIELPSTVAFGLFEPIPGYVIGYAALGLAVYAAAAALHRRKPTSNREARSVENRPGEDVHIADRCPGFTWRTDRFWAVSAGLGLLMFVSYLYLVASMGAIPALSEDAGEVRLRILRAGPAEAVMFTCAWTLIPTLMMYVWYQRPSRSVKLLCFSGVGVCSLLLLSLGGRSYLFVPLLTTLIARHYAKHRFAIRKLVLVGVALFCSMSFLGYVRDNALNGTSFGEDKMGIPGALAPFVYAYLYVRYPVATFRDITATIPRKVPYQYGALSLGPLATLLPGHHEQSDMFFKNILGNDFIGAGQPATLLGPLYADAGLGGILAALFLVGIFAASAYGWMLESPTVIRVLLYAWLMQTLLFSLFANLFPYLTTLWMPAFWMVLDRFLQKTRVAGGPLCTVS